MTGARSAEDLVRALRAAGISDERLLQAVLATPRADFVPADHVAAAYRDVPIPIGYGQVTTQPSMSAVMIQGLGLGGGEHVLDVGTGLGFQTADVDLGGAHLKLAGVDWLTIGRKLAAATDPEAASPEHHARHHQRHHGTG